MPPGLDDTSVADFLRAVQRDHLLYECAGVFWLWAELVILFIMREGRRALAGVDSPPWPRRFAFWMLPFFLLCVPLLLRDTLLPALEGFAVPGADPALLAQAYTGNVLRHLTVWSAFVVAWVLLESAIVFEGARAYRHFSAHCRRLLRPAAATCLLCLLLPLSEWASAAETPGMFTHALSEADAALQPYRNLVYLHLRIAGIIWIAVEWVAAILLWRGQRQLWRLARATESAT